MKQANVLPADGPSKSGSDQVESALSILGSTDARLRRALLLAMSPMALLLSAVGFAFGDFMFGSAQWAIVISFLTGIIRSVLNCLVQGECRRADAARHVRVTPIGMAHQEDGLRSRIETA